MTDKQIIIDGVDVSGCKYWKGYCRIASLCDYAGHLCEVKPNCYYKQLKRKEQECEELKIYIESNEQQVKEVETLVMDNDRLINELNQLKQTLTEIKEIIEQGIKIHDDIIVSKQILQKISEVIDDKNS